MKRWRDVPACGPRVRAVAVHTTCPKTPLRWAREERLSDASAMHLSQTQNRTGASARPRTDRALTKVARNQPNPVEPQGLFFAAFEARFSGQHHRKGAVMNALTSGLSTAPARPLACREAGETS
jgi:hypothetical protein